MTALRGGDNILTIGARLTFAVNENLETVDWPNLVSVRDMFIDRCERLVFVSFPNLRTLGIRPAIPGTTSPRFGPEYIDNYGYGRWHASSLILSRNINLASLNLSRLTLVQGTIQLDLNIDNIYIGSIQHIGAIDVTQFWNQPILDVNDWPTKLWTATDTYIRASELPTRAGD